MEAWLEATSLATNANYRLRGKNSRYDLVIATSMKRRRLAISGRSDSNYLEKSG